MTTALVLSGGGARGAYEVGVLSYLFDDLADELGTPFDIVCGTSVGAVNGAFLASVMHEPQEGIRRLVTLWRELSLSSVLGFGVVHAQRLHRVLFGGRRGGGLFDTSPLSELIVGGMDWGRLSDNLKKGHLQALTVTATHVPTGRPTCFIDRAPGVPMPRGLPRSMRVRPVHIRAHHVLASAAIPVVFPPVFIRADLYCDGGLRLNTPLSPAVHLGADRVLVIGMSAGADVEKPELPMGRFPGLPFLLGKVFDAFLLDHVNLDLEELERTNAVLRDGVSAYGDGFIEETNRIASQRGAPPRRIIDAMAIRPTRDIGEIAAEFLQRERVALRRRFGRAVLRAIDVGEGADTADLASYLLFDGEFAQALVELGRTDAEAQRDELVAFLRPPT